VFSLINETFSPERANTSKNARMGRTRWTRRQPYPRSLRPSCRRNFFFFLSSPWNGRFAERRSLGGAGGAAGAMGGGRGYAGTAVARPGGRIRTDPGRGSQAVTLKPKKPKQGWQSQAGGPRRDGRGDSRQEDRKTQHLGAMVETSTRSRGLRTRWSRPAQYSARQIEGYGLSYFVTLLLRRYFVTSGATARVRWRRYFVTPVLRHAGTSSRRYFVGAAPDANAPGECDGAGTSSRRYFVGSSSSPAPPLSCPAPPHERGDAGTSSSRYFVTPVLTPVPRGRSRTGEGSSGGKEEGGGERSEPGAARTIRISSLTFLMHTHPFSLPFRWGQSPLVGG